MHRFLDIVAAGVLLLVAWMAWRAHAWGKGAFFLPTMLVVCIAVGTAGVALWTTCSDFSRRWCKALPRMVLLLCIVFVVGQLAGAYTTWAR